VISVINAQKDLLYQKAEQNAASVSLASSHMLDKDNGLFELPTLSHLYYFRYAGGADPNNAQYIYKSVQGHLVCYPILWLYSAVSD
jgi:hypothetical protein